MNACTISSLNVVLAMTFWYMLFIKLRSYLLFPVYKVFVLLLAMKLGVCITFFFFFLVVLGLRFCARAFSSCGKWGPLFITVCGPLTIAASLVEEHRLQMRRLSSCGSRAQSLRGMWDLPRPGLEPAPPALAGRFSTTVPPGKPCITFYQMFFHHLWC